MKSSLCVVSFANELKILGELERLKPEREKTGA